MRIQIVPTIADVGELAWNELVPDGGFYSSFRWIRGYESVFRMRSAYICLRDSSRYLAIAPVSFTKQELSQEYSQQRFEQIFEATFSCAVLGPRRGYRNLWLIHEGLTDEDRTSAITMIVESALEVADGWGANAVVAPYLTESALGGLSEVQRLSQSAEVASEGILELPGTSFEDYLAPMRAKNRGKIRRERAQPLRLGLRFQVEPVETGVASALAALVAQVEAKYGRHITTQGLRRYLEATFEANPADARLFTCRNSDGRLVSGALAYEWGDGLYVRATATDYDALPVNSFAHFNVTYFEPIAYSAQRGLKRIYFGIDALETKIRRGCQVESLHHALLR